MSNTTTSAPVAAASTAALPPAVPAPRMTTRPRSAAGQPAQQQPLAAMGLMQQIGSDLDGNTAGDIAHRREQRQPARLSSSTVSKAMAVKPISCRRRVSAGSAARCRKENSRCSLLSSARSPAWRFLDLHDQLRGAVQCRRHPPPSSPRSPIDLIVVSGQQRRRHDSTMTGGRLHEQPACRPRASSQRALPVA